ncbi:MAG: hypothetical protein ACOYJD_06260 [Christensenellales bacterium]|jgi:hypothetical protein
MYQSNEQRGYKAGIISLGAAMFLAGSLAICSMLFKMPLPIASGLMLPAYCISLGIELCVSSYLKCAGKATEVKLGFIFISVIVLCIINASLHLPGMLTAITRYAYFW